MSRLIMENGSELATAAPAWIGESNIRFIFGLKVSELRKSLGLSLKEVSQKSGLSISYLNEIEKGKKYPKSNKILALAAALDVSYDTLVSSKLEGRLEVLNTILHTRFLRDFPLATFGIDSTGLITLMANAPERFSALIHTFVRMAKHYDMSYEKFSLAALRSLVELRHNFFEEIEQAAESFVEDQQLKRRDSRTLRRLLTEKFGFVIDDDTLADTEELRDVSSTFVENGSPTFYLNRNLLEEQKSFMVARELGFLTLGLKDRVQTAQVDEASTFDQLFHNFQASYFAGALLMPREKLIEDIRRIFKKRTLSSEILYRWMEKYRATPELLFHRLSQLLPQYFGFKQMFFFRTDYRPETDRFIISKEMHFSRLHGTHSLGTTEHYCRRWTPIRLLKEMKEGTSARAAGDRVHFKHTGGDYLVVSIAYRQSLRPDRCSAVTLGFILDEPFKRIMRSWDNEALGEQIVNDTCERCPILDCQERAVPPSIYQKQERRNKKAEALKKLT